MGKIMQFYTKLPMQKLLFFSRVAFICNICFVLTWGMHYYPDLLHRDISSTIIVMGYVVSALMNMAVATACVILFVRRRLPSPHFPLWLIIVNFLFLILQLILVLK